jgi:hypothetical protein
VAALDAVAQRLRVASAAVGQMVDVDLLDEVGLRARVAGFRRNGAVSCGGASRLLHSGDGVVAVTLAREADVELVPALVERGGVADAWDAVVEWVGAVPGAHAVERARLLGLPVSQVVTAPDSATASVEPLEITRHSRPPGSVRRATGRLRVVDLSALWAGPLCARLLGLAGADVVKVECLTRPDGARRGPVGVWNHLHTGHRSVALDLTTAAGRHRLRALMAAADVVVEASRPRALAAWGLAPHMVAEPPVWVSITADGYGGAGADRVGFGDDVAAGAGLLVDTADGPWFCADAVADPLTGCVAATVALEALATRDRVHLDVSMHDVARQFAGRCTPDESDVHHPDPRFTVDASLEPVAPLGADSSEVFERWCS